MAVVNFMSSNHQADESIEASKMELQNLSFRVLRKCRRLGSIQAFQDISTSFNQKFSYRPLQGEVFSIRASPDSTETTATSSQSDNEPPAVVPCEIIVTPPKKNKSVSFAPTVKAVHTLARTDLSSSEKQAAWFSRDEYTVISRQVYKQIRKIENGCTLKDNKYCSRGLESRTRTMTEVKMKNREAAYVAVLDYYNETAHGVRDDVDDKIAERYMQVSSSCQKWANVVGLRDQRAAENYLFDIN